MPGYEPLREIHVRHHAHFTAFLAGVGYQEPAWKLADPADLAGAARFGVLERAALDAERGLLDAVFFADSPDIDQRLADRIGPQPDSIQPTGMARQRQCLAS
jgi:hypothetical protein